MNETLGVLSRKFGFTDDDLKEAESLINTLTHRITPTIALDVVKSDPTDNRILECAEAANSDFIISGDKHLLRLRQHNGKPIIKVSDFLSLEWFGR